LTYTLPVTGYENFNSALNWDIIESVLMSHYTVGTSGEGSDAYPPLHLFKCPMLQKCFRINSDTELKNQFNDRLSLKSSCNCLLIIPIEPFTVAIPGNLSKKYSQIKDMPVSLTETSWHSMKSLMVS